MSTTPRSECSDDVDIYADLLGPNQQQSPHKLKNENIALKEQVSSLKAELESLQSRFESLKEVNKNLRCNISVLYKTAVAETERKDSMIAELRRELDNLLFRRNKGNSGSNSLNSASKFVTATSHEQGNTNILSEKRKIGKDVSQHSASTHIPKKKIPSYGTSSNICKEGSKKKHSDESHPVGGSRSEPQHHKAQNDLRTSIQNHEQNEWKENIKLGYDKSEHLPILRTDEFSKVKGNAESSLDDNKVKNIGGRVRRSFSEEKVLNNIENVKENASGGCDNNLKINLPCIESEETASVAMKDSGKKETKQDFPEAHISQAFDPHSSKINDDSVELKRTDDCSGNIIGSVIQDTHGRHSSVLDKNFTFCPPLPQEDPAPLPPLPSGSPPRTPHKQDVNILPNACSTDCRSSPKKETDSTSSQPEVLSTIESSGIPKNPEKKGISEECPHVQFPFKSRYRVKSLVVIDKENEATSSPHDKVNDAKDKFSPPDGTKQPFSGSQWSSMLSWSSSVNQKKTGKKDEALESRHMSDSRPLSRPSHNRHSSSSKWSHTPERRSPSELLNRRSCRIERVSHQDKIRIRIRDRRSRSLSPLRRCDRYDIRLKREDHLPQSRGLRRGSPRRGATREDKSYSPKTLSKRRDHKSSFDTQHSTSERRMTRSRANLKSEIVKYVPDGQESRITKIRNVVSSANTVKTKADMGAKQENTDKERCSQSDCSVAKPSDPEQVQTTSQGEVVTTVIYVNRRRSRAVLKLEESEAAPPVNSTDTQTSNAGESFSPLGKQASSAESKQCSPLAASASAPSQSCEESPEGSNLNSRLLERIEHTPLYFREQANKTESKNSSGDDCFSESEESSSSAGSDVSYKPSYSRKRTCRKDLKQSSKKRAVQK